MKRNGFFLAMSSSKQNCLRNNKQKNGDYQKLSNNLPIKSRYDISPKFLDRIERRAFGLTCVKIWNYMYFIWGGKNSRTLLIPIYIWLTLFIV